MAGQYERYTFKDENITNLNQSYWLLTSRPSIRFVWFIRYESDLNYSISNDQGYAIKPTLNLEKNVTIVSGTGTKADPFVIETEKDEGRIRIVNREGVFIDYLKYEDGTYVKDTDTFKIVSDVNNNYVVETASGLTDNNTNIQLYTFNNSNAQKWKFNNSTTKNYYNFVLASNTSKAIDIYSGLTADGTNIQLYDLNTSNAQKWSFVESGEENVYYIRSNIGTCMDIKNGEIKNGANIQSYTCNKSSAQKWKIEKVD